MKKLSFVYFILLFSFFSLNSLQANDRSLPRQIVLTGPHGEFYHDCWIFSSRNEIRIDTRSEKWFGLLNPYFENMSIDNTGSESLTITYSEGYFFSSKSQVAPFKQFFDRDWKFLGNIAETGVRNNVTWNNGLITEYVSGNFPFQPLWEILYISGKVSPLEYAIFNNTFNYDFFPSENSKVKITYEHTGKNLLSLMRQSDAKKIAAILLDDTGRVVEFVCTSPNGKSFRFNYVGNLISDITEFRGNSADERVRTYATKFEYVGTKLTSVSERDIEGKMTRKWSIYW